MKTQSATTTKPRRRDPNDHLLDVYQVIRRQNGLDAIRAWNRNHK